MGIGKWFKTKLASMALAVANVEHNALGQSKNTLSDSVGKYRNISQGTLMDNLMRGELTQEVKNVRWRMYKIMKAMDNIVVDMKHDREEEQEFSEEVGEIASIKSLDKFVDLSIIPKYDKTHRDRQGTIKKVIIDDFDPYELEMVVFNEERTVGIGETFEKLQNHGGPEETVIIDGEQKLKIGIDRNSMDASVKTDRPIKVLRDFVPKFYIENYTKKLNIRKITDDQKLLEFYISKMPTEYTNTANFISEIKRLIERGPRSFNFLEIDGVSFLSNDAIGVEKYKYFEYKITKYDKIVEFDGYYVIKFFAEVVTNGADILEAFIEEELEEKYKNKEARTNDYRYT